MEGFNPANHIELMKIIDPRVHVSENRVMEVKVGGLNVTVLVIVPSSNSTTLTYAVTSPSPNCILARNLLISYTVQLIDNSANGGAAAYPGINTQCPFNDTLEGPRGPYPLQSSCSNTSFSLNGVKNLRKFAQKPLNYTNKC